MDSEIGAGRANGQETLSLVSTLLSDPATVARLMRALSEIGGEGSSGGAEKSENSDDDSVGSDEKAIENTENAEKTAPPIMASAEMADTLGRLSNVISSITSPSGGGSGGGGGKHTALLLAIKPYLSQRRGELIDDIIRLSSLGDLLGGLGEGGRA